MVKEKLFSTGQAARYLGVSTRTVYRLEAAGKIQALKLSSGRRRFQERDLKVVLGQRKAGAERAAIYARVSSGKQVETGNLDRQRERLWAAAQDRKLTISAVIVEQASGLNEKRRGLKKLFKLAATGEIDIVLVEFKDRLARFGYNYLAEAFAAHGVRVEVLDGPIATDAAAELVQDMLAIVTCFAARLYGSRSQQFRRKVKEAAKEVEQLG